MDFSAPSPSSSSDSRSSYSPRLMSSDLGLDPSDPLNLLLHNTSQSHSGNSSMEESSQEGGSPPDWSQLSSLWPDQDFGGQTKPYSDMMDFSELATLSMDVDFGNAIAIEPSALHYNPIKYNNINTNYSYSPHTPSYNDDLLAAHFPFTFQPNSPSDTSSHQSSQGGRRLSITSSSSASLSPAPESTVPSPVTAKRPEFPPTYANTDDAPVTLPTDAASQLAERVRQSAGVMLALPMNAQLQAHENQQALLSALATSPTTLPKLPIPRLPRHISQSVKSVSTVSSAASTPPPSTPSPPPMSAPAPVPARPKTSHTTIERRYRTNLNARIQSLRMAVPALRVVEDREGGGGKKRAPNKVLVSGDPLNGDVVSANGVVDVIDERGFVDGVKVARKCSKANVLGKAVEYIRVLKKREGRLKAEQAGLKSLVAGLVGGPALLREWEREWREMFGGEEKDEVEGEMEGEGDEDDSEEEQEDEDEGGRKRKRGKTTAVGVAPAKQEKKEKKPVQGADGVVPEKRKRGRPRKVIAPVVPPQFPVQDQKMEQEQAQGPQQYLLATFALFSFFNSPLTSSSPPPASHVHTGTVLNSSAATIEGGATWGVSEYMQMFHLLVSVVVLLSFVSSWAGFSFTLGKSLRSGSVLNFARGTRREKRTKSDWVRLGEECVLSASNEVSLWSRIQIYHRISSSHTTSIQELITAALTLYGAGGIHVFGGLVRARARAVWASAKSRAATQSLVGENTYERMVLEDMTLDAAAARLAPLSDEGKALTPMQLLATSLIRERIRSHLGVLFVRSVNGEEDGQDKDAVERETLERERTIDAAKELGGGVGDLGRRLEQVWKVSVSVSAGLEYAGEEESAEGELLKALVLHRRVFRADGNGASALMSPGGKDMSDAGMLRRALGSRVFEEEAVLEDARDRAVDMVVELERRSVGLD
ncbi:hypothetical protein FPV67DRAFT_1493297 [Lyophyllum atratum]|nr:hypothetical protein FPV67DRAFT_1493297 [Lyophyllum atratum]